MAAEITKSSKGEKGGLFQPSTNNEVNGQGTSRPDPNMATIEDDDERLLARIGYKQELKREFTKWSTVSYAVSILGVLGSVPATYGAPISAGGPATAVWAWFIGSFMAMAIASSVAELVSAYPTAGGMYFVTKHVVPKEHVAIWAWIIGWCNFLGQAAGVASLAYTIAQMIFAAVVMNSSWVDGVPSFAPWVQSALHWQCNTNTKTESRGRMSCSQYSYSVLLGQYAP